MQEDWESIDLEKVSIRLFSTVEKRRHLSEELRRNFVRKVIRDWYVVMRSARRVWPSDSAWALVRP